MRIHHSDNRRKEETRRDEVRRREVRGTLRMSEVATELGEGGELIRTECVELTIMLFDKHFMDFEKSNERMFHFF
jgi:hypothetical protein